MKIGKVGVNYKIPGNVEYNIYLFKACSESKIYFGTAQRIVGILLYLRHHRQQLSGHPFVPKPRLYCVWYIGNCLLKAALQ